MPNSLSVAGWNSKYKELGAKPAGFWGGLWHGIIAPITFVVSLFVDGVSIYETTNNGRWYEFGFMLGIGAYAGSEAAKPLQKRLLSPVASLTLALFPSAKVSIRAGVPQKTAREISGHKTDAVFSRDIVSEADIRDAARKLEAGPVIHSSFAVETEEEENPKEGNARRPV
jgi:hypothetical protein